jgi:hypothetical protein
VAVNLIKDCVLACITTKKEAKKVKNELTGLISQAQEAVKVNDLTKLQGLLENLTAYQNICASAYENKRAEIEQLERFLASADLSKYRELVVNSLQAELKKEPFPVSVEELNETNRDFVEKISQLTDQEELGKIKDGVLDNIGEKRAGKLVDNLLVQIKKEFTTEEERSTVCQEIYRLGGGGNK